MAEPESVHRSHLGLAMLFLTFLLAFAALLLSLFKGSDLVHRVAKLQTRLDELERRIRTAPAGDASVDAAAVPSSGRSSVVDNEPAGGAVSASQVDADHQSATATANLERRLDPAAPPPVLRPDRAVQQAAPVPPATSQPASQPSAVAEIADSLFRVIKRNPFASAGVIMFMIGLGFLFALLAAHNILTPAMRVAMVAAVGTGVFVVGLKQESKRLALGWNLEGGALAIEYLCVLWAFSEYHLIAADTAFVLLGALSTLAYGFAVMKKGLAFAFVGMAGGVVTPIVTSAGHGDLSALVVYCMFIVGLSILVGRVLKSISLPAVTYVAVMTLLGSAAGAATGNPAYIVAGCSIMSLSFLAVAVMHVMQGLPRTGFSLAAVLLLMLMPPVTYTTLLGLVVDTTPADRALLPAASSVVLMLAVWRVEQFWQRWLVVAAALLALIAISMRFHGSAHAIAVAASAVTLILAGQVMKSRMVDVLAWLYWVMAVAEASMALADGAPYPMYCVAIVTVMSGFACHGRLIGKFYIVVAPPLLCSAVLDYFGLSAAHLTLFMLTWAVGAALLSKLRWPDFKLGSLWLVPALTALLISSEWTGTGPQWLLRELLLGASLSGSAWWGYHLIEASDVFKTAGWKDAFYLLLPLAVSIEVVHGLGGAGLGDLDGIAAALALTWSLAGLASQLVNRTGRTLMLEMCGLVTALLTVMAILCTPLATLHELLLVAALAILAWQIRVRREALIFLSDSISGWLAASAVIGGLFQLLGRLVGLDEPVLQLVVQTRMQPTVSLSWAVSGILVVALGSRRKRRDRWLAGAVVLTLLIAKMFVIDLASLTLAAKVGTFMAVGVGLIALGTFCPVPPKRALSVDRELEPQPRAA